MKDKNGILKYMIISLCLGVFLGWFIFGFLNVTGNATKYDNSKNVAGQIVYSATGCDGETIICPEGNPYPVCQYYNGVCQACWCQSKNPRTLGQFA